MANGSNGHGRDRRGRFKAGNQAAAGRSHPFAARVSEWREAMARTVTAEDIREVFSELVKRAKAGERWAVKELLTRTIGVPEVVEAEEPPTITLPEGPWSPMIIRALATDEDVARAKAMTESGERIEED